MLKTMNASIIITFVVRLVLYADNACEHTSESMEKVDELEDPDANANAEVDAVGGVDTELRIVNVVFLILV